MKARGEALSHSMQGIFLFLLIGLFALMSLTLTLIGTRIYRDVALGAQHSGDSQTILSYLSNKVRAYDITGGVAVGQEGALSTLCLRETLDGQAYETTIYVYQGSVCERFALADEPFDPEDGQRLAEARSLTFAMPAPGLVEATVVMPDGEARTLRIALRTAATQRLVAV